MKKKLILFTIVAAMMISTLTGCGGNKASTPTPTDTTKPAQETPAKKDSLVIALSSDSLSLDPHKTDETVTNAVNLHIFEALIFYDKDLKNMPCLATEWKLADDGVTWTFKLREGVKFHNGNAFTADDVVYTFERIMKSETLTAFKGYLATVDTVKAINDYEVQVVTKTSYPIFAADIRNVAILDKETCENLTDEEISLKPIGTGRYKLVEHIKEDHIDLEANSDYWGGEQEFKTVRFRPITNEATRTATMLSGEVDMTVDLGVRDIERIEKTEGMSIITQPSLRILYLNIDGWRDQTAAVDPTKPNPLKDLKVRQAIYHAIDADTIVKNVMNNHAYTTATYIPEVFNGHNSDIKRLAYDPEKAKALMAEAGYKDGFTITFDAPNDRYVNDGEIAQAVTGYLEKIGIKVNLNLMPKSLFFTYIKPANNKSGFLMSGWADCAGEGVVLEKDLLYTFGVKDGYGGVNRGQYSNPEVDTLIDQAMSETDDVKRAELVAKIDAIATSDVAYIPLHFEQDIFAVKSNINYTPRVNKYLFAWDLSIK